MEIVFIIPCDGGRHLSISYGGLGDTLSQPFGVGKYKQDAKREYCLTGAYLGVRDRKQTQARQSIATHFVGKKIRGWCAMIAYLPRLFYIFRVI